MSSSTPTDHPVKVPFFKKGKSRPSTVVRKKSPSPDPLAGSKSRFAAPPNSNEDTGKSSVVLPTKKASANLLSAGTKRTVSQRDTLNDDDTEANAQNGHDVKWSSSSTSHINAALDILAGDEAEELLAKRRKKEIEDAGGEEEIPDDGLYRGQAAYKSHLKKNTEVPKAMRIGPQRNTSSTIRTVTIVDYQPDVCKDYKETGYCGFGDTCKFLHDRGTYLAGWQLDKLAAQGSNKPIVDDSSSDDDSDEDIPFACLICRKPFTDPVATRCEHYFCSACAIKRFSKTPKCAACGAPTGGIFNKAVKVIEKMKKMKEEEKDGSDNENEKGAMDIDIEGLAEQDKGKQKTQAGASDQDSDSDEDEDDE